MVGSAGGMKTAAAMNYDIMTCMIDLDRLRVAHSR